MDAAAARSTTAIRYGLPAACPPHVADFTTRVAPVAPANLAVFGVVVDNPTTAGAVGRRLGGRRLPSRSSSTSSIRPRSYATIRPPGAAPDFSRRARAPRRERF